MHSIRGRIIAITAAAVTASILVFMTITYFTLGDEAARNTAEKMNMMCRNVQLSLDEYLASIRQSVEMAARFATDSLDPVVLVECGAAGSNAGKERTRAQARKLDMYLAEHSAQVQEAFASVASHTSGVVTYYYCIAPEISGSEHGFFYSKIRQAGFSEQPPLVAQELDPADTLHTTWYFTPVRRGRPSWVGPYLAHFLDEEWTVSYLAPVYRANALIGVMGMDILLDTMIEKVDAVRVADSGYACLFDTDLRVLYHPILPFGSDPEQMGTSVRTELLQRDSSGDDMIRYEVNGQERQLSFSTLDNGMTLVITAPTKEITAQWGRVARIVLIASLIVIAVFAVVLMLVMRVMTRPLQRLTVAARRLAAEDYDAELDYHGKDEIGELTGTFKRMRDQLKTNIEDLNRRIYTDSLTGLPNMTYFFELAEAERRRIEQAGGRPAMLYINLIGMKHYNRQFGFEEGNRLICAVADILKRHFGEKKISHLSQDHFAAVTGSDRLEEELQHVFRECQQANEGRSLPIRVGIFRDWTDDINASTASDRAKFACDRYRDAYDSCFYYFDDSMQKQAENVRYIISHLDQALAERLITVYYQPIVRAVNGRVCDEEALARWLDPEKGMLSPGDFIPILEDARLIYKLDLYIVDQVLEKMRRQKEYGLEIVPHSVNLSRSDFDACDIVEEIRRRVDAAGMERRLITIEITESVIGSSFDFIKAQVERFRALGFPVWMDDFGSGYSSLDVLQSIQFDLIKFDMSFMQRLDEGDGGKIILTELMKMANALGVDTVCEGVETAEQARFLREIGCSKLQGYYYCKPISFEMIQDRYRSGRQIGFENPTESEYFETIGRVNLYDLAVIANENENAFQNYFNTLPMSILQVRDGKIKFVRSNQSYRDFMKRFYGFDLSDRQTAYTDTPFGEHSAFMKIVRQCCESDSRAFFDEQMPDDSVAHSFARRIAVNPLTGSVAVAIVVLSITEPNEGETYASIARALAADYYNIYCVDLDTEKFIEYSSKVGREELAVERRGEDFFAACRRDTMTRIYEKDREGFLAGFSKEQVIRELDEQGVYTATYRLIDTGKPLYANMKITRMQPGGNRIIMGISIIDSQMRQKELLNGIRQERDALARLMALTEDYMCLYSIHADSSRYVEYTASEEIRQLGISREGEDFFRDSLINTKKIICPEDWALYSRRFRKEISLSEIRETGVFKMHYRLTLEGELRTVTLRIAPFKQGDEEMLLAGVRIWRDRK